MLGPRWLAETALGSGIAIEILAERRGSRMQMSFLQRGQTLFPARVRAVMNVLRERFAALGGT